MVKCDFCGEKEGTELIDNPNYDGDDSWKVCKECKTHIREAQTKACQVFLGLAIKELENKKIKDKLEEKNL